MVERLHTRRVLASYTRDLNGGDSETQDKPSFRTMLADRGKWCDAWHKRKRLAETIVNPNVRAKALATLESQARDFNRSASERYNRASFAKAMAGGYPLP